MSQTPTADHFMTIANRRSFSDLIDEALSDVLDFEVLFSGEPIFENDRLIKRIENWDIEYTTESIEDEGRDIDFSKPFWVYSYYQFFCEEDQVKAIKTTCRESDHSLFKEEELFLNDSIEEDDRLEILEAYQNLLNKE